jgi:hypothetical protein
MFPMSHPNPCVKYIATIQNLVYSLLNLEGAITMIFWKTGSQSATDTASHPRKPKSPCSVQFVQVPCPVPSTDWKFQEKKYYLVTIDQTSETNIIITWTSG